MELNEKEKELVVISIYHLMEDLKKLWDLDSCREKYNIYKDLYIKFGGVM